MQDKLALSKIETVVAITVPIAFAVVITLLSGIALLVLGLTLLIIEIIVLGPLARRWRASPIFWPAAFASVVPSGMALAIETALKLELHISIAVVFLTGSFLLALLAARLTDPEIRRSAGERLREWLQAGLGEPPGAYWMIVLWIVFVLEAGVLSTLGFILVLQDLGIHTYSSVFALLSHLALPVALVAAALHWATTRPEAMTRTRQIATTGLVAVLAIGAYLAPHGLTLLPRLFGADVPGAVSRPIQLAWVALSLAIIFVLAGSRRHRLSTAWRTIIVGTVAGAMLIIVLAYPVYTLTYTRFVPGFEYTGLAHERTITTSCLLGIVLGLTIGPAAVLWGRLRNWQEKLTVGAAAGALAGVFMFGCLGGPAAGLAAQSPLYGVALSRVGYGPGEWILKLDLAVNATFPATYGAFWLLIGGGALVGGLTGLLTPARLSRVRETPATSMPWTPVVLVAVPLLAIVVLVNMVILNILGGQIQNLFDNYGFVPRWHTDWIPLAGAGQPWLVLIVVQVLGLRWFYRQPEEMPRRRLAAMIAFFTGLIGLIFPLVVWLVLPELWVLTASLATAVLSLEMLAVSWRLWKSTKAGDTSKSLHSQSAWITAGAGGGILAAVFSYQLVAAALNLVLVAIVMIIDLGETTAPPPGLAWLEESLSPLFEIHLAAFIGSFCLYATLGAFVGLALANWPWQWVLWIWSRLRATAHRTGARIAILRRRWSGWAVVVLGGVLLAGAVTCAFLLVPILVVAALAAAATFFLMRGQRIERSPWSVLALAFAVTGLGLVGLALQGPYKPPLDNLSQLGIWLRLTYALVVGPAAGVMCQAMMTYTPDCSRTRVRLVALLGVTSLVGILGYSSQEVVAIQGGVSRFDGQQWEIFTSESSAIGGRLNYQFFEDSQGHLWYSGGSGVIVGRVAEGWRYYLLHSTTNSPREELLGARLRFLEDQQGRLWVAESTTFGQFDPAMEMEMIDHYLRVPSRPPTETEIEANDYQTMDDEVKYVPLILNSEIMSMALDAAGDIWLATNGNGALRLESNRDINNTHWEFFTTENSGLASNDVYSVYADRDGSVWFGTAGGLSCFDGLTWKTVILPALNVDTSVVTFLEDSRERLWVGATRGGYWWDGKWTSFDEASGWPTGSGAKMFFEDTQGGLWAGTDDGAFRFDGQKWGNPVPDLHVTTFAEGPSGVVWVGSQQGLTRYYLATGEQSLFNAENSGMAVNWVRDLHVDTDGGLWISTFEIERTARSPWWAVGLSVLFFGYLFANTLRGYEQSPETRARRLERKIAVEPDNLYPTAYTLLAGVADAPDVLTRLAGYLARAGDPAAAEAVTALAALPSEPKAPEVNAALDRTIAALASDSARVWAEPLYRLYGLLAVALAARRVPEIADLELVVNPGQEAGSVSLHSRTGSVKVLPSFLPRNSTQAWRALERVGVALRKYQEVDAAADRLSYLAEALAATEAAQTATRQVGPPEGIVMLAVVDRWRAAVTDEIDAVSGRAELRLELRTRQMRRAARVTLALHLQNTGRAAAENVVVSLQPGEALSSIGETQIVLERLSSGRSTEVEFAIAPPDAETARVVCRITWNDRVADGNAIEFADLVRFYEVAEEFQRIPNPYIVGHPVKSAEMFHGREDIFQFIADNLSGSVQDRTLVLHGQRRTGKTSILYQLLRGQLGEDFVPVLIDMQELAILINSTGDFLGELAYQLARTARKAGVTIEEPAPEVFAASPTRAFNRFLDVLGDSLGERRVVVMFDEFELIESKIAAGKLDADLLGYFRSLMQHRDCLVFIFTGTHQLEEMSHDYWSVFFNIALYRRVSFLSPVEATRLIREPVAGALDVDELAVEKIIGLTSGHPYFIQLICWAMVNHCNAQKRNYATINDVNEVVQEILMTGEAHFAFIWQQATGTERLALAGLAHTLRPGKVWARPVEILETLAASGDTQTQRAVLVDVLDQLVAQEVLEVAGDGALRYHFQLEVLRLWVKAAKSIAALVERER